MPPMPAIAKASRTNSRRRLTFFTVRFEREAARCGGRENRRSRPRRWAATGCRWTLPSSPPILAGATPGGRRICQSPPSCRGVGNGFKARRSGCLKWCRTAAVAVSASEKRSDLPLDQRLRVPSTDTEKDECAGCVECAAGCGRFAQAVGRSDRSIRIPDLNACPFATVAAVDEPPAGAVRGRARRHFEGGCTERGRPHSPSVARAGSGDPRNDRRRGRSAWRGCDRGPRGSSGRRTRGRAAARGSGRRSRRSSRRGPPVRIRSP